MSSGKAHFTLKSAMRAALGKKNKDKNMEGGGEYKRSRNKIHPSSLLSCSIKKTQLDNLRIFYDLS